MRRHMRLHKDGRARRVDARRQVQRGAGARRAAQVRGLVRERHRVQIDHAEVRVCGRTQPMSWSDEFGLRTSPSKLAGVPLARPLQTPFSHTQDRNSFSRAKRATQRSCKLLQLRMAAQVGTQAQRAAEVIACCGVSRGESSP